jgi:hypothetical protein
MKNIKINGFKQISKGTAKKLFKAGKEFYICLCNLAAGGFFRPELRINPTETAGDFNNLLIAAQYYNCNPEAGRYLRFYIKGE